MAMTGTPLPRMTPSKRRPTRVLTAVQRKRRAARQAAGIKDVREATPEQIERARADGLLPQAALVELQRRRRQRAVNQAAAAGDIAMPGKVPPGTPHSVQQALALGAFQNVSGTKRKRKVPITGRSFGA